MIPSRIPLGETSKDPMEGSALGALGDLPKGFPTRSSRELGKLGRGIGDEYLANQGIRGIE